MRTAQGRQVPAEETVWMRTREVWIHAVDLDNGGRFGDFPAAALEALLTDIAGVWGLVLAIDGREPLALHDDAAPTTISGALPAVVRWAAGRGPSVSASKAHVLRGSRCTAVALVETGAR